MGKSCVGLALWCLVLLGLTWGTGRWIDTWRLPDSQAAEMEVTIYRVPR